jgi:hypothetical protein
MDLKNSLISIQTGIKDPTGKAHLPFRQGNSMKANDKYILNEDGELSNKEEEEEIDKREEFLLKNLQNIEESNKNAVDVLINSNNSALNNEENTNGK